MKQAYRRCLKIGTSGVTGLWLLVVTGASAQLTTMNCNDPHGAQNGGFEVDVLRGCRPHSVRLESKPATGVTNVQYLFDYQPPNGTPPPVSRFTFSEKTAFTYQKSGRYTIVQRGTKDGREFLFCRQTYVEVYDADLPPKFSLTALSQRRVSLQLLNGRYDEYTVDWGDGSPPETIVQNSQQAICHSYAFDPRARFTVKLTGTFRGVGCGNSSTEVVTPQGLVLETPRITRLELLSDSRAIVEFSGQAGIQVEVLRRSPDSPVFNPTRLFSDRKPDLIRGEADVYNPTDVTCFKVKTADECASLNPESEEVCTIPLVVSSRNKRNTLVWKAQPATTVFALTRNDAPWQQTSARTFTDPDAECRQRVCYRVSSVINGATSLSTSICLRVGEPDSLPALAPPLVSFEGNQPRLTWAAPPGWEVGRYLVDRSEGVFGPPQHVGTAPPTALTFVDGTAVTQPVCYRVGYTDLCDNPAPATALVCPVFLKAGSVLQYTPYHEFEDGPAHYELEELAANAALLATGALGPEPAALATGAGLRWQTHRPDLSAPLRPSARFRVKATSATGLVSYSNPVEFVHPVLLFVPEIFTPNGDGINDRLEVRSRFVEAFRLVVFNRWGEILHQSETTRDAWDGTHAGQPAPEGSYTYRIEFGDAQGQKYVRRGSFLLKR